MMKVIRGVLPASSLVKEVARKKEFPYLDLLHDEVCFNILQNVAVETFTESSPESGSKSKTGVPLGALAEGLVIHITGLTEIRSSAQELIESHPILQAYGSIEEMFLD